MPAVATREDASPSPERIDEMARVVDAYRRRLREEMAQRSSATPAEAEPAIAPALLTVDDCDPPTTRPLAECWLGRHAGQLTTERERRMLVVAYFLVGDRERGRAAARAYLDLHPTSPFRLQIRLLSVP